jgi:adenylate cyclase
MLVRNARLITGLILFAYLTVHLSNHALGLISLNAAENALRLAVIFWHSWLGTSLLYGAATVHFLLHFRPSTSDAPFACRRSN